jgi:hypothetical protein
MILISGSDQTSSRLPGPFSLFLPGSCPNNRNRCTLCTIDPGNNVWQRDLQSILLKLGDILAAEGNQAEAVQIYKDSLGIARALAQQDTSRSASQVDVVLVLWRLALQNQNPHRHLSEALAILKQLEAQNRATSEHRSWIQQIGNSIADLSGDQ